ncbi:BPSS1780 family membrane protein [Pseudomarimonas salicorniae]|uniref:DUF7847 domain-containing protein n=1 Tax=Pseudomarimonas salicorniae TaxID=2933270 RepID=A0ABT0GI04_9GAMM|nr:BPSS1780 family membrane protein [Lysobacter sp. CAU 1642]MCK7593640.1 hypothetical protein [Lysobacter sp. CAU 1642]
MNIRRVDAGQGIAWLTESVQLLLKNPAPFALMGLVIAAVLLVPLLGSLAMAIAGPALYGGIMFAAREESAGRKADFQHLFAAFQQPGKAGPMLTLCLPGVVAGLTVLVLGVVFIGSALLAAGVSAAADADALAGASLGAGGLVFVLLALAVGLFAYALVFFATPRVMLDGIEPITAMKESLRACLANWAAVLVFVVVLAVVAIVASLLLGWVPLLGHLLITVVLVPVVSTAIFFASREVFGTGAAPPAAPSNEGPTGEPPAPPPSVEA